MPATDAGTWHRWAKTNTYELAVPYADGGDLQAIATSDDGSWRFVGGGNLCHWVP